MEELTNHLWWQEEFSPTKGGGEFDYIARDGRTVVAVKNATGIRGLYEVMMHLALSLSEQPEIERACLVLVISRLSMDRVRREWTKMERAFHPMVTHRLSLVAIGKDQVWVQPDDEFLRRIAKVFQVMGIDSFDAAPGIIKPYARQKHLEVLKVLIYRWLMRKGAIPIGKLAEQVGCAYSTAKEALDRLNQRQSIARTQNRSVELTKFPISSWHELLVLSKTMGRSFRYSDVSGEKPDPERLLKRLERMKPQMIAVGGVVAARHWHPDFDLNGTPRLDLLLHTPADIVDLTFVKKLDPALRQIDGYDVSPVLVVRPLQRCDPLFDHIDGTSLPLADPVETTLDLCDLGLTAQASQLLAHIRPECRIR